MLNMHNGSRIAAMSENIWNLSEGFEFVRVPLVFEQGRYVNVFAGKNNATLAETLEHSRYAKLKPAVSEKYAGSLDQLLGKFLLEIKELGDPLLSALSKQIRRSSVFKVLYFEH